MNKLILTIILLLYGAVSPAQKTNNVRAIYSGIPWYDDQGKEVSAHGAGIIKDHGRYYLFGESKSDTSNAFVGFSCYSSEDLYNWKFERIVLPPQDSGRLGPNRVGERPKVMRCPQTGAYVMFMHTDNLGYKDPAIGYATSDTINGIYTFQGPLLLDGQRIRKWDMGVFQDTDGIGYVIAHSGNLYQLSEDYMRVTQQIVKDIGHGESPVIFKKDGIYYWLASNLTSWERNDNFYFTAPSLKGPWTERGHFAPEGTLTWNSQCTFVLPIAGSADTTLMYMGDRWAFPRQHSAATYVWQPMNVSDSTVVIPSYHQVWQVNTSTGLYSPSKINGQTIENTNAKNIQYHGKWVHSVEDDTLSISNSDTKEDHILINFEGTQIGLYALARPDGGYAGVILRNSRGDTIQSSTLDLYSKYLESSLKFLSPVLAKGEYTLTISVLGEHGTWSDKKKNVYGSTGDFVSLDKLVIRE